MVRFFVCGCAVVCAAVFVSSALGAGGREPLVTGVSDPLTFPGTDKKVAFDHVRGVGATVARLVLNWSHVAPGGARMPAGFDPRNPRNRLYRWSDFDRQVQAAARAGLSPIIGIQQAPEWAQGGKNTRPQDGPNRPSVVALADFATAAARRYGGGFKGLPRVRYWQVWNEPNLSIELMPQYEGKRPVSAEWYRGMVNAVANAVHAVRRDNLVIAGGLAPFGGDSNDPSGGVVPGQERVHPLAFMRHMLCMSEGANPRPTCGERTEFDVWAHHPYTYGGPTHKAFHADDVSLGDLGKMRSLLNAASGAGRIKSRGEVGFWVTEFSYDSKPADPRGLDPALHTRWVSEALYRMWQNGVSLVTWFLIRDEAFPDGMFQSGLYYRGSNGIGSDRPKPALRAFRFPFVAFREPGRIFFWGRTPPGSKKDVIVEVHRGDGWRRIAVPRADRHGIFSGRIPSRVQIGSLRARLADRSDASVPFGLRVPPDFRFCPWGSFC